MNHRFRVIRRRVPRPYAFLLFLVASAVTGQDTDWIPVDSIPERYVRTLRSSAVELSVEDPVLQLRALRDLENEIADYDPLTARAAAPLLADLARREHRIVSYPRNYRVPPQTRIAALRILGTLGGEDATAQLHDSLLNDSDDAVRSYAALLLASVGEASDADMDAITVAVTRARSLGTRENEVFNYLVAVEKLIENPWIVISPALAQEIVAIATGAYSSRTRSKASRLLEVLMDR